MKDKPRNLPASVRQRLLNLSRERKEEFQNVLTRYAMERILYRLGESRHRSRFTLKGAMLFSIWGGDQHRATWDIDLLGKGQNSIEHIEEVFREICRAQIEEDGIEFLENSVRGSRIREDQEYEGVRIQLAATLAGARISVQIDIGFGDVVTPAPVEEAFPVLLDFPAPSLRVYPIETVIAEKFHALVILGMTNSRMKDFYDIWTMSEGFEFDGAILSQAIRATFNRRKTPLPAESPLALTPDFSEDTTKQTQWKAFLRKGKLETHGKVFSEIVDVIRGFLMPPALAAAADESFEMNWPPQGHWNPKEEIGVSHPRVDTVFKQSLQHRRNMPFYNPGGDIPMKAAHEYAQEIMDEVLNTRVESAEERDQLRHRVQNIIVESWHQERNFLRKRIRNGLKKLPPTSHNGMDMIGLDDAQQLIDET